MKISQRVFKLKGGCKYITEIAISKVQRAVNPKVGKQELWFLCSACCPMVFYICVNFHENISNGFQVTE